MTIVLVKCPRYCQSHFEENSESLALAYLAAVLRKNRNEVDILDASLMGLSLNETSDRILRKEYELIGFTIADPTFIESTFRTINDLRRNGVKSHITMGGHTPTFHYKECLEMCAGLDSIVMYEGEETIVELAEALRNNKDWHNIRGIVYKSDGHIKYNPPRPLIFNLDTLPFPSRDTLPFLLEKKKETGVVSMSGGRGCYMSCGFCSIKAFYSVPEGLSWRLRSNEKIVDEMECLVQNYGIKEILFVDDIFVGPGEKNMKRILQLADGITRRNLRVILSISERADNIIKVDLFKRLREVGLRQILLGVESGSQEILNYLNKGITPRQIEKAMEILQGLDIDITISFINFTPITTLEKLRENIRYLLSLRVNILQGLLNRFQIFSGTPLGDELNKSGLVKGKFPNFSYSTIDRRVDITYEIVKRSLGTFLSTAFELKKLERALRIKLFQAEVEGRLEEAASLKRDRMRYNRLSRKIMEEAVELLSEIINFCDSKGAYNNKRIEDFTNRMVETSFSFYKEWSGLIQFLRRSSSALSTLEFSKSPSQINLRKEVAHVTS
jgi:anaerobic magnesium-protoporphyrin IX monomethyl ester cyclase